jgi:hypothetical protein
MLASINNLRKLLPKKSCAYNGPFNLTKDATPAMRIAKEALTFDDVLLQPGYSDVPARSI